MIFFSMDKMDTFLQKEATFALVEDDVIIILSQDTPKINKIRGCDEKFIAWFWKSFAVYFLRQ